MRALRVVVVAGLVGCTSSGTTGFEIDGSVQGPSPPPSSKVVFVWDTLQTTYKWGDGDATAMTFSVVLDPVPPDGAQIAAAGMAVGIPVLIDDSATIPDGVFDFNNTPRLGVATDYAIIWKDATAAGIGLGWDAAFGASYSCARCVRGGNGAHDSWELTPCANLTIEIGGTDVCNWN